MYRYIGIYGWGFRDHPSPSPTPMLYPPGITRPPPRCYTPGLPGLALMIAAPACQALR